MFDKHMALGIGLPTVEPETAFKYFIPSVHNLLDVQDYCTILINFQHPWTNELIDKVIKEISELGFKVLYCYNSYDIKHPKEIPMPKIRHDTFNLMPNALYFALVDDDMKFLPASKNVNESAGKQYLRTLHYFLTHSKCGLMLFGGSLIKSIPKYHIGPTDLISPYLTNKGLLCKNMSPYGLYVPLDSLDLVGANEERLMAAFVLSKGYYPARLSFGKTTHYEYHYSKKVICSAIQYGFNSEEIVEANVHKYIRDHYNPKYDASVDRGNNVIDAEFYYKQGGPHITEQFCKDNMTNYEEYTVDKLKNEINELLANQ